MYILYLQCNINVLIIMVYVTATFCVFDVKSLLPDLAEET